MIISSGENIYPSDIEKEAIKFKNIVECCAIGIPDKYFGEALFLVCVLNKDKTIEIKLRKFLRERLANFQQPLGYDFVASLPNRLDAKLLKNKRRIY